MKIKIFDYNNNVYNIKFSIRFLNSRKNQLFKIIIYCFHYKSIKQVYFSYKQSEKIIDKFDNTR